MTTAIALAGLIALFLPWLCAVGLVEWSERHRPKRTGLTRLVLGMTLWGAVMMYFGLAASRSLGQ